MCGIAGFAGNGDLADLRRMNAALVHRGPDDEGIWLDGKNRVFLGHRRLSILDIGGGHQPMWTADAQVGVIFNGEIYNHVELRAELKSAGHVFRTDHSDTEVLLHGYRQWGEGLPGRLNGMWAFAIYDRRARQLFCSRDRFGKKPFFYTVQRGTFAFASELSALVRHRLLRPFISKRSLKKYFAYGYIPAPNSIYEGIYKLPAGHSLVFDVDKQSLTLLKYWDFIIEPFERIPAEPEREWGEQLVELLGRAVKRRLMSDVPLGFFLSGGIDSSSVVAMAARHVEPSLMHTFNIGFEEDTFDESGYANRVASLLGTRHHPALLSVEQAGSLLPEIARRLDEPMGDSSLLPTYLLSQHTRKHVTVALGGDGADELFAGYDPFRALKAAEFYHRFVPKRLHEAIRLVMARMPVSHANMSLDFKIKRTLRGLSHDPKLWCPVWMGPLAPEDLDELFREPTELDDLYSEAIEQWEQCRQSNLVDRTLQFYTKLYLQDDILVKVDRASMMHSLEVRAPYLDIELVDFVRRIPHQYKFRGGETKYLLKKALRSVLPAEILYRKKKGFGIPIGSWLKRDVLQFDDNSFPFVSSRFVAERLADHKGNRSDERALLWNSWLLNRFQVATRTTQ
jgi:asparagine synthase (glutamine-hydrolysing)